MLRAENDEEAATFVLKPYKDQNGEKVPNDDIDVGMAKLIDVESLPTGELRESLGYRPVIVPINRLID
ncbi:hypothetical protein N7501_007053 [Penicillium viridicatum]|nr:hypothetical protein N7501_007053 [Penicillium viridicatum]